MQWIMSVFAVAWRRMHLQTGHAWGGRFFSRLIASLPEFMQPFRICDDNSDDNPVKACPSRRSPSGGMASYDFFGSVCPK
jgi:hypothetical protein